MADIWNQFIIGGIPEEIHSLAYHLMGDINDENIVRRAVDLVNKPDQLAVLEEAMIGEQEGEDYDYLFGGVMSAALYFRAAEDDLLNHKKALKILPIYKEVVYAQKYFAENQNDLDDKIADAVSLLN